MNFGISDKARNYKRSGINKAFDGYDIHFNYLVFIAKREPPHSSLTAMYGKVHNFFPKSQVLLTP